MRGLIQLLTAIFMLFMGGLQIPKMVHGDAFASGSMMLGFGLAALFLAMAFDATRKGLQQ